MLCTELRPFSFTSLLIIPSSILIDLQYTLIVHLPIPIKIQSYTRNSEGLP